VEVGEKRCNGGHGCIYFVLRWHLPDCSEIAVYFPMKLTPELIAQSPSSLNAIKERQLDLRGRFYLLYSNTDSLIFKATISL
jgi:hypothetical protein